MQGLMKLIDGRLHGEIVTRRVKEKFTLMENRTPVGQKPAHFVISATAPAGHSFQAGLAWRYRIERGDHAGKDGFNLLFNDPDYGEAFWVSAFPKHDGGWELSVKRDTQASEQDKAQQAA